MYVAFQHQGLEYMGIDRRRKWNFDIKIYIKTIKNIDMHALLPVEHQNMQWIESLACSVYIYWWKDKLKTK